MGDVDEICNTRLGLGIGLADFETKRDTNKKKNNKCKAITTSLNLSIPLHPKDEGGLILYDNGKKTEGSGSIANGSKEDEEERQKHCFVEDHNNFGGIRKKLRLTAEQSSVLEDSFRHQTTLNTAQKQVLAQKLNLKPRQVEVWFQNRRARTKLKQTEVDCEYLRKRCEHLNDENRRLKKELQELRLLKSEKLATPPLYIQIQKEAATNMTNSICPNNFGRSSTAVGDVKSEKNITMTAAGDAVQDKPNNGNQCKHKIGHGFNLNIISEVEVEVEREREMSFPNC